MQSWIKAGEMSKSSNPILSRLLSLGGGGLKIALLRSASLLIGFGLFGATPAASAPAAVDLLIRGGTVFSGDLANGSFEDVGVSGDKIVFVGDAAAAGVTAAATVDATGMIVAPGFIDGHVHTEADMMSGDPMRRATPTNLMQGVTTNIIGVDGGGTPEVAERMAKAKALGIGVNFATYVGFGAIRQRLLGQENRAPTPAELEQMKALVAKGMCGGAIGLSTGLFYAPQSYAKTEEVIALAKEAALRGGIYDSHQRDEGNGGPGSIGIENSVKELIRISKEAGLPGHFAHLKDSGVFSWGKSKQIISLIEQARAGGQEITADQYPYLASGGGIASILLPRWALDGGRTETLKRLADPAVEPKIRAEMTQFLAGRGGGKNMLVIRSDSPWVGKTLAGIAATWKLSEIDAAERLYREGDPGMAIFAISEDDVRAYMPRPWVMTGSDGSDGHPRKSGTFAFIYLKYVVQDHVLTLPQFIHRSTGLEADTFRLDRRGYLKPGYFADVVVFDPARYAPRSTYVKPLLLAQGVRDVLVNGRLAVKNGEITGDLAGRPLPHPPTTGTCS